MNVSVTKPLTCNLCSRSINLAQDTVTDEDGNPVHEECYADSLLMKRSASNSTARDASQRTPSSDTAE